jgi:anti-sigma B factor antagonist
MKPDGTVVVTLTGEYDLAYRPQLRVELDGLRDEPNLIVDLSAVTFIDSTCIGELVRLHNARAERGFAPLTVVQSSLVVKRLFEVLNLGAVFRLVETLDEALPQDGQPVIVQYAVPGDEAAPISPVDAHSL